MKSRTLFNNITLISTITSSLLGCGGKNDAKLSTSSEKPTQTQVDPSIKTSSQLELSATDMTIDSSGPFPRFTLSKAISLKGKIQVHFNLHELDNLAATTREQLIVPFDNEKEVTAALWVLETPATIEHKFIKNMDISKDDIGEAEAASIKFYNITEGHKFRLRIIFSNSNTAQRTSLVAIDIPLEI